MLLAVAVIEDEDAGRLHAMNLLGEREGGNGPKRNQIRVLYFMAYHDKIISRLKK